MPAKLLKPAVFLAGLLAVCWIGAGYAVSNPLALSVVALIGGCYVAGAMELRRYRLATATLASAVDALSVTPTVLGDWLQGLHPSLRNATRLRIEGERTALPAPALTPYLVGLLVLLGMLGTLLGMMSTLKGTGMALESAVDLQAIRTSLAAPVKGLAFAFGTSIAGVAASAMLGLLSALCRRERARVVLRLDAAIATTLRIHSAAHQREEAFKLLQQQVAVMPALVDRLQAMMATMEQQGLAAHERQLANQHAFHESTEAAYTRLATSVEASLQHSVADSARAAVAALQPAMEGTMAAIARETAALHDAVSQAVQQQLDGLSSRFETSTATVADIWNASLAEQRRANDALAQDLRGGLERFNDSFDTRSAGLVESLSARIDTSTGHASEAWQAALSHQQALGVDLAARNEQALVKAAAALEQHAGVLVSSVQRSHEQLQTALQSRDGERLEAWARTFDTTAQSLAQQWQQIGDHAAARQQAICDALANTAAAISAQTEAHAKDTIAEISRLVETASEAPRAAADVIAELRQKLSDSMVRDTAMLEERTRLLATLETLLDAVNHASTEQRASVDALIGTSADLLERVGTRFTDQVQAQSDKLDAAATRVSAGAIEIASLGDAFALAVQQYGASNEALIARLQTIEGALDKSLARSDEQLAYYVAQAREVVDLSMLAQKQIIQDLQQLADQRSAARAAAA